jgi:type I restriction enzyme S subunit
MLLKPELVKQSGSTTLPIVSKSRFQEMTVPVPPIMVQRRIAAILDKAEAMRRKREEGIRLTEDLLRSTFLDLFGDPETNPKRWKRLPFPDLLRTGMRNGISPSSDGSVSGKVLVLSAITGAAFDQSQVKEGRFVSLFTSDQLVSTEDFLICRGNGNKSLVGRGRFPTVSFDDTVFPDTMIAAGIDSSQVAPLFIERLWETPCVRRQIEDGARTTNGTYKINQKLLAAIKVPVPPLAEQMCFVEVSERASMADRRSSAKLSSDLFDSLVQRAFRGDL